MTAGQVPPRWGDRFAGSAPGSFGTVAYQLAQQLSPEGFRQHLVFRKPDDEAYGDNMLDVDTAYAIMLIAIDVELGSPRDLASHSTSVIGDTVTKFTPYIAASTCIRLFSKHPALYGAATIVGRHIVPEVYGKP